MKVTLIVISLFGLYKIVNKAPIWFRHVHLSACCIAQKLLILQSWNRVLKLSILDANALYKVYWNFCVGQTWYWVLDKFPLNNVIKIEYP